MKIVRAALLCLPSLLVAFAACSPTEKVDPLPVATATATTEPTTPLPDAGPLPDGAPAKRTMTVRNPLGEGPANNLLLDGDFELSSSYGTGQYGWRMFAASGAGEVVMTVESGGLCHSGLSCVKLQKGVLMLGRGTAAAGGKAHVMSLYAKLPEGLPCGKISPIAIDCDSFTILKKAASDEAFSDGWCHYAGSFGASDSAVCLYIQNTLGEGETAILDSAVLGPADGTVPFKATPAYEPDAETLAEMARVRDLVRRTTPFGAVPGSLRPDPRAP